MKQIGTDEVYCVRTIVDTLRVCTGIIHIKGGELDPHGPREPR